MRATGADAFPDIPDFLSQEYDPVPVVKTGKAADVGKHPPPPQKTAPATPATDLDMSTIGTQEQPIDASSGRQVNLFRFCHVIDETASVLSMA
jgi:hypothetical protein